jgi:hypothetical protein
VSQVIIGAGEGASYEWASDHILVKAPAGRRSRHRRRSHAERERCVDEIRAIVENDGPLEALVLDLEDVNFIDSQGSSQLAGNLYRAVEGARDDLRSAGIG